MATKEKVNKAQLARRLGISRMMLYYQPKQPAKDEALKAAIEEVMKDNPAYGHKRIAMELKMGKKRVKRVMKNYGLTPVKSRQQPPKPADENKCPAPYPNILKTLCPIRANVVWVSDFTYIKYQGQFIYLATIMDRWTREIVGVNISQWHNKELVIGAFNNAKAKTGTVPAYTHSDQGSEFDSEAFISQVESLGVIVSMSDKGKPWQNGHQESFYSHYKFELDVKQADRFATLGELIEAIYLQMHYYNTKRIHTALRMPPRAFRVLQETNCRQCV
jgi:putative transposase